MIILSTLVGFLSSALPDFFRFLQDGRDKKHEKDLLLLQMEHQKQGHQAKLAEIELQADIADSSAVGSRVQQSLVNIPWVDAWNGTVRPFYAYAFFILYALVKYSQWVLLISPELPWQEPLTYSQALVSIWTQDDMALFAAIVTFYFGQRSFHKLRGGK